MCEETNTILPKLPVPSLEQTLRKYEKTMKPLLNEAEQKQLKKIIEEFSKPSGVGPKLQHYLLDRHRSLDNWAYEYWINDMYLGNRAPIPITSNPAGTIARLKFTTTKDMAHLAAKIINSGLRLKKILNCHSLPVERAVTREPGQPLCMAQYYRLLGSTRLPGNNIDSQYVPTYLPSNGQSSEHIIIICHNQFYCLYIPSPDVKCNEDQLCDQILYILDDASCLTNVPLVGLLTSWKRQKWWEAREILKIDKNNSRNLELIDKSLFIICLDKSLPTSFNLKTQRNGQDQCSGRDETNVFLQMLHGGGTGYNSANRWFDKAVQFIISEDGAWGICNEHSLSDGIAVIRFIEHVTEHLNSEPASSNFAQTCAPERLEWSLSLEDYKRIEDAGKEFDYLIKDLDFEIFRFQEYGKEFIKTHHVSPDAFIQLALQLTYYKIHGKLTATYETASTRRFKFGRVDCIRSATPEALEWVLAMTQWDINKNSGKHNLDHASKIFNLWNIAIKQQTKEMIDNILGQGIDIHLLGLREAAKTTLLELPELFTDNSYRTSNKFLLSTSQVATKMDICVGYGAVEPDGYSVSYNPMPDLIIFGVSAFCSSQATSVFKFTQTLEESLISMQHLLAKKPVD